AERLGMYIEIIADLPADDPSGFERTVRAAKEAGALCLRSACLSGRRYETFSTLEEWKRFVIESKGRIDRALPILEKYRMPLGLENHKDWTAEEQVALLKEYGSEYLGACIDTGNNIALLDDPMAVVARLAWSAPTSPANPCRVLTPSVRPSGCASKRTTSDSAWCMRASNSVFSRQPSANIERADFSLKAEG